MTINNNTFGPSDSSDGNALDAANQFNPAVTGSASGTSYTGGAYAAGSSYSSAAGVDADLNSPAPADSGSKLNTQMLADLYNQANRWVRENPTVALSVAAGIAAAVFGVVAATRSTARRRDTFNQYPSGQSYGNAYGNASPGYSPTTQTETIERGGNYTSSGSDAYTGYDSAGDRPVM